MDRMSVELIYQTMVSATSGDLYYGLSVHNLGLRDVDNIVLLKDLIKLNLSNNSLSIVKVLGSLTSLMELDLSENEMYV